MISISFKISKIIPLYINDAYGDNEKIVKFLLLLYPKFGIENCYNYLLFIPLYIPVILRVYYLFLD